MPELLKSRHLGSPSPEPGARSRDGSAKAAATRGAREAELRELWRRYKQEGDDVAREQLVLAYSPLVKFAARRLGIGLPSHVDSADLISYGLLGLIGAIERFEPERGIRFETFAMARIRGSIIDALRSLDWVPRSVRARAREVELAQSKLEQEPSVCSLDEPWALPDLSGDQVSLLDTISDPSAADPQIALDTSEIKGRLADAIGSLAAREQLVIALYYYENLTLREIGEVLDVTESRVSQLHTRAVMRLKSHLQGA